MEEVFLDIPTEELVCYWIHEIKLTLTACTSYASEKKWKLEQNADKWRHSRNTLYKRLAGKVAVLTTTAVLKMERTHFISSFSCVLQPHFVPLRSTFTLRQISDGHDFVTWVWHRVKFTHCTPQLRMQQKSSGNSEECFLMQRLSKSVSVRKYFTYLCSGAEGYLGLVMEAGNWPWSRNRNWRETLLHGSFLYRSSTVRW